MQTPKTLNVDLGSQSYPIYIGEGLLSQHKYLTQHLSAKQVMVVTNETVAPLYLSPLNNALKADGFEVAWVILKDGEQHKTLDSVNTIIGELLTKRFHRNCTLIALGGGVVGDITGFAAACYQRGVNFIQIPTTLLAQVDSSVGGKTGVNHPLGKNMMGAFYQPKCVLIDIETLQTLPKRQFAAGMAEVIKYGLIMSRDFLNVLENNISRLKAHDKACLTDVIFKSCAFKAQIVSEDEKEAGKRALLNLGHTFGHAIEKTLGYGSYLHGEAVAVGMVMAAELSHKLGYLSPNEVSQIQTILQQADLPITLDMPIAYDDFMAAMSVDKKNIDNHIRLILLKRVGEAFICDDYAADKLTEVVEAFIS